MEINSPIEQLLKINSKQLKTLNQLGILSIKDLLLYFPRRHIDFSSFSKIADLKANTTITIVGTVKSIQKRFSFKTHKSLAEAAISDETGSIQVTWFNQAYIASIYKVGDLIALSGKVTLYKKLQLLNPVHEKITQENIHTGRLVPIYKLPENIYSRTFRNYIQKALPFKTELKDNIPQKILKEFELPGLEQTVTEMHFPETKVSLNKAKERLIFEEVLIEQLAVGLHKQEIQKLPALNIQADLDFLNRIIASLPFELTSGQKNSLKEILNDLKIKHPMNRLLEGDVGSGKTLVAFLSMLATAEKGLQTVLLAPTEVLAKQHYENLQKLLSKSRNHFSSSLLTRNFSIFNEEKIKPIELKNKISTGQINILIGTHAVLTNPQIFKNLALVVIDEQHRFGVDQRSLLLKPRDKKSPVPHMLSMSATPIPRTLALTLYSDLEVSRLTELPKGRINIQTFIVPEFKRKDAYEFIKKEIQSGRQAFIITPLVEESEKLQVKSVKEEFARLQTEIFPELKLGIIYGGLKGAEKDMVMQNFQAGKIDILVSTSVVEVGVDVPNATIMLIEGAERFGLAQLHQLRGRVGRGTHKSYCMLFPNPESEGSLERLNNFTKNTNGFELAEIDLENRGFGSLFGNDQSGFNFKFSEYLTIKTLKTAKQASDQLLMEGSLKTTYPKLFKLAQPLVKNIHLE